MLSSTLRHQTSQKGPKFKDGKGVEDKAVAGIRPLTNDDDETMVNHAWEGWGIGERERGRKSDGEKREVGGMELRG